MKKEKNRYFLVEYGGKFRKVYNSLDELNNAIDIIRKYNNRTTVPYIIGNMSTHVVDSKFYLDFHVYNKLTDKTTISELDKLTSTHDEYSLIIEFKDKIKSIYAENNKDKKPHYPDINIAYFEDRNSSVEEFRRIKYIPILYKDDLKYLDINYICDCIKYHADNYDYKYFEGILKEFRCSYSCDEYLEKLRNTIEQVKYNGLSSANLFFSARNFYIAYIVEMAKDKSILRDDKGRPEYSRRRLRDFGFYTKNYEARRIKMATINNYSNDSQKQREVQSIVRKLSL